MIQSVQAITKRNLIIASLLFVAVLVAVLVEHIVIKKELEAMQTNGTELRASSKENVALLRQSVRLYGQYDELLNTALVERENVFVFVEDLQRLAAQSNLLSQINTLTYYDVLVDGTIVEASASGPLPTDRSHGELNASLIVSGEWSDVLEFLQHLETIPVELRISGFRLASRLDEATSSVIWQANISMQIMTQ